MKKSHKVIAALIVAALSFNFTGCSLISSNKEDLTIDVTVDISDDIFENATTFMNYFKEVNSNGIYAMGSENFKKAIEKKDISEQNHGLKKQLGDVKSFSDLRLVFDSGYKTILAYTEFEKGSYDVRISFSDDGKYIEGYSLQESVIDGERVNTDKYSGEAVAFESDSIKINGTFLKPKVAEGKVPVVILLQGSGSSDRDETVYGLNKPLRDIAEGLAQYGIASLRYDKRTYTYGSELTAEEVENISVDEEYTNDLTAAIEYLKSRNEIDADEIYILGHSLSGYLIPYFYEKEPSIKGGIALAGTIGESFEDLMKYQYEYLANYDNKVSDEEKTVLDEFNKEYELVKKLKKGEVVDQNIILGIGQKYWSFFNNYDGVNQWKNVSEPTLVLQGERDYQVPMDNFNLYKDELASKENFQFNSYKKLSHLFMEGSKNPTPNDYTKQGKVDKEVIEDIANWINE